MNDKNHPFPVLPNILPQHNKILEQIPDSRLNADGLNKDERNVSILIARIPFGKIASYGTMANWAYKKYGYTGGNARVVANIRMKLYAILGHHVSFPLWRLTKSGDIHAKGDSVLTRICAMEKRTEEGSWDQPIWFDPDKYYDPF